MHQSFFRYTRKYEESEPGEYDNTDKIVLEAGCFECTGNIAAVGSCNLFGALHRFLFVMNPCSHDERVIDATFLHLRLIAVAAVAATAAAAPATAVAAAATLFAWPRFVHG
jgi:hypothetical protein